MQANRESAVTTGSGVIALLAVEVLRAGKIIELRELSVERESNRSDRTIPLFADDDLRRALVRAVRVVNLVAIDEQDHVGILLDSAGFTQVGHDRPLVRALLETAVELRQGNYRNIEFLRKDQEFSKTTLDLARIELGVTWDERGDLVLPVRAVA